MRNLLKKYIGFSFIELLLTMMILGVIMLLVSTTLNTVIRASNTANSKNLARSDINYVMDIYNRLLTNAELTDIYLFNSESVRNFALVGGIPRITTKGSGVGNTYVGDALTLDGGELGNEVHVKLYGYSLWTCLGYFRDSANEYGYIVKTSARNLTDHASCFSDTASITILHSFAVNAEDLTINYVDMGDDRNSMFLVNATLSPLFWPLSNTSLVTKEVSRQIVVSTQALTWY